MTLEEIYNNGGMSARSYNACRYNGLNTLEDIAEFYIKHKLFKKLPNCGDKSNDELIKICLTYQSDKIESSKLKEENNLKTIISELTRIQREVINNFIFVNTNNPSVLSVRSRNAISSYLNQNLKIKNFASKILISNEFTLKDLNNIGKKCIPELKLYINSIEDFLNEVSKSKNEKDLISLKNNFLIQKTFSISKIPLGFNK